MQKNMVNGIKRILGQVPLFLFLVPVFFVLHGFLENWGIISFTDYLLLTFIYAGAAAMCYFSFLLIYKNYIKASLLATLVMSFYLFFGALHDFLKLHFITLSRYGVLLPGFLIALIIIAIYVKRSKHPFFGITFFLNILLLIYLLLDLGGVIWKLQRTEPKLSVNTFTDNYKNCNNCTKPDIYFLLFDEYARSSTLKNQYNYDNSGLDTFLLQQGFHIQRNSRSNYCFTLFSMASMLNMSYLNALSSNVYTVSDYPYFIKLIRDNEVSKLLTSQGYDIVNYSVFDLAGKPSLIEQSLLPIKTKPISDRTLFPQVQRDMGWWLFKNIKWLAANNTIRHLNNDNNRLIRLVENESAVKSARPRFVYTHLILPHPPFFYDKNGAVKDELTVFRQNSEDSVQRYLDYLPYTNTRIKEVISTIQQNTKGSAVIIFMSDHGLRQGNDLNTYYQNQNAVYLPGKDYTLLYDSITGVNQFRVIFSQLFREKIPLLPDLTIRLSGKQ